MKYSIIFCYRNRKEHLNIIVPRIKEVFCDTDHEIIVVEQDDDRKFRRGNLLNVGAKVASGEVLIFHDVDYYPTNNVTYYDGTSDVYLPVKRVEFVLNDLSPRPVEEIPGGYQHFKDGVDDNFFGAVEVFRREAFFKVNGFNPLYVGWGFEDTDLRERIYHYGLTISKNADNLFYALEHVDSGPSFDDPDFRSNIHRSQAWSRYLSAGVKNQYSSVRMIEPNHKLVDKWIMATEFDGPTFIVRSEYNFDD